MVETWPPNTGGADLIPGQEAKIPQASQPKKKKNLKWTEFVLNVFSEKQIADQPEFFLESDIKINVILSWIIIVTKLHFPFSLDLRKESKSVDRLKLKKALS